MRISLPHRSGAPRHAAGLKIKLLSSIVAITAIQTLRDYMDLDNRPDRSLAWSVTVHLTFLV